MWLYNIYGDGNKTRTEKRETILEKDVLCQKDTVEHDKLCLYVCDHRVYNIFATKVVKNMQKELFHEGTDTRIKELRKSFGYTQDKLAELLDITTAHVRSMESGRRGISVELLIKMKKLFNVSIDYLLTGADSRNDMSRLLEILSEVDPALYPYIEKTVILMIQASTITLEVDENPCKHKQVDMK